MTDTLTPLTVYLASYDASGSYIYTNLIKAEFMYKNELYSIRMKKKGTEIKFLTTDESKSTKGGFPVVLTIPNISTLTDEQFFQQSLVWDHYMDIHLVRAVQEHLIQNVSLEVESTLLSTVYY